MLIGSSDFNNSDRFAALTELINAGIPVGMSPRNLDEDMILLRLL